MRTLSTNWLSEQLSVLIQQNTDGDLKTAIENYIVLLIANNFIYRGEVKLCTPSKIIVDFHWNEEGAGGMPKECIATFDIGIKDNTPKIHVPEIIKSMGTQTTIREVEPSDVKPDW